MTLKTLIKEISKNTGYTQKDITTVVDTLFDTIAKTIPTEEVSITGFGKFETVDKPERDVRNPLTGQIVHVAAKKAPKFKASTSLKAAVN